MEKTLSESEIHIMRNTLEQRQYNIVVRTDIHSGITIYLLEAHNNIHIYITTMQERIVEFYEARSYI